MALYLLLQKPALRELPTFTLTAWVLAWGLLPMAVWCAVDQRRGGVAGLLAPLANASSLAWGCAAYGGLMASGVAYVLVNFGVRHVGATTAASFVPLQPFFSAALSALVLEELPTPGQALGGAAIVVGMYFVTFASEAAGSGAAPRLSTSASKVVLLPEDEESVMLPAACKRSDGR